MVRFLVLLRDHDETADKATYYLEQREGISNTAGIANMRDAVSHFVRAFDEDLTDDQRNDQIANAEEHLRRSILEPYEVAVSERLNRNEDLCAEYKSRLIPAASRHRRLADAPNEVAIESQVREINQLITRGRDAKRSNLWDERWENGTLALIDAHEKASNLHAQMERYFYLYLDAIQQEDVERMQRRQTWLAIWGIVATAAAFLLGLLLAL